MFSYRENRLFFNELDLSQCLAEKKTPLYVYDMQWLRRRFSAMREALGSAIDIHYAVKANPHPEVLKLFNELGSNVDVVSAGEMKVSLEAGFNGSQVIFSGVAKRVDEIHYALKNNVGQLNVESFGELRRIAEIASDLGVRAPVALRVNPDVNPETHPYITTGFRDNKFGIEPARLGEIQNFLLENPSCLQFVGLSIHIGSQLLELDSMAEATDKVIGYVEEFSAAGLAATRLDLGGGLGIFYQSDEEKGQRAHDETAELELLERYARIIRGAAERTGLQVQIEPGRWLVGHAGVLLTEVQYLKETEYKNFVIADTGMHHLLRPALYQAHHEVYPLLKREGEMDCDVVGPICESSDVIARNRSLSRVEPGDILVIADVGAYGACLASRYNLHALPEELIAEG